MTTREIVVRCEQGLHLRMATKVARVVRDHQAVVHLSCEGCPKANGCSLLELISLEASSGTHLKVDAEGPDEAAVLNELANVFEQGAGI
jgi:phosphotransferase system HPr (HPr) family protein